MELSEDILKKGYWYYSPEKLHPPQGILLSEYAEETKVCLYQTKGGETAYQINKREKSYTTEIPEKLQQVKTLWVSHINQNTFDSICELENLEGLYVDSNNIKSIDNIKNLKYLKHLALLNLTKIDSLEPLEECDHLQTLKLENLKKIFLFNSVSKLINLKGLEIDGDMYTAQKIENFNFISSLEKLQYLSLSKTKATVKDFTPISKLTQLISFASSSNYPKKEFQKLNKLPLRYFGNVKELIKN
jgi:Leucine-rich repeat (LRR) protein